MTWRIRPGAAADCETIAEFNLRLATETEALHLDRATVRAGVAALLADPQRGRYLVAADGERILGQLCITLEWSDWWNGWYWWIQSVYVEASARGQGVFKGLFQQVVAEAQAAGNVAAVRLYVEDHNAPAHAVYQKLGMKSSGYRVLELKCRDALVATRPSFSGDRQGLPLKFHSPPRFVE